MGLVQRLSLASSGLFRRSKARANSLFDDAMATYEAHRVFLSVAGTLVTAAVAFYTVQYRKFQQQKIEKKMRSLDDESLGARQQSAMMRKLDLLARYTAPAILLTGFAGYAWGYRRGHYRGAKTISAELTKETSLRHLEKERIER